MPVARPTEVLEAQSQGFQEIIIGSPLPALPGCLPRIGLGLVLHVVTLMQPLCCMLSNVRKNARIYIPHAYSITLLYNFINMF